MNTIKVTVGNRFARSVIEEFFCVDVDMSSLAEIENCAEECVGQYLDMHENIASLHTLDFDEFATACYYTIEEVIPNEF